MRIAFLGTSEFARPTLQALMADSSLELAAVVTQLDRPQGRGHRVQPTPVKALAMDRCLTVYQPPKVGSPESREYFTALQPELLVVVSYGQILPAWLLQLPRLGAVNVHASLLPKYRGAAPIQWALLEGETSTGVTVMQMDPGLDTGPILLQQSTAIAENETAGELHDRLAVLGAELLIQALGRLRDGTLERTPQESSEATLAPKINKEMGRVDWKCTASELHNRIRAFNPWPGCLCTLRGLALKIWRSSLGDATGIGTKARGTAGQIRIADRSVLQVYCGDGDLLQLREVSIPGRRRVSGVDLVHGLKIRDGEMLG